MAKSAKPKSTGSKDATAGSQADATIEDAEVVEETTAGAVEVEAAEDTPEAPDAPQTGTQAVLVDDPAPDQTDPADSGAGESVDGGAGESKEDEAPRSVTEQPPVPVVQMPPPQRVGFFRVVLGGVIAAGLGAGALFLAQNRGWVDLGSGTADLQARIDGQTGEISGLKAALDGALAQIETLKSTQPDGAAIDQSLSALSTASDGARAEINALGETVAALRTRIEDVETQPIPKAELPAEVVAAYEAQLGDVLAAVDTRFTAVQAALDSKLAAIEAAQAAAVTSEQDAVRAADAAAARAAMSQVVAALDSGVGYAEQLGLVAEKAGTDVPAALADPAVTGVPTIAALASDFPAAARAALKASIDAAASDGTVSPLTAFFRTQLGARSLEPRQGTDPDAVLSRAEAAVAKGDLDTALTEIATLPAPGQEPLADWVAAAQTRRAALRAAAEISAQLNN
ncbi:MAG: hypothetical protein LJE68_13475 [Rhodobacter sp.]|nr:hypothetical protein [Rhodobacter sp.]